MTCQHTFGPARYCLKCGVTAEHAMNTQSETLNSRPDGGQLARTVPFELEALPEPPRRYGELRVGGKVVGRLHEISMVDHGANEFVLSHDTIMEKIQRQIREAGGFQELIKKCTVPVHQACRSAPFRPYTTIHEFGGTAKNLEAMTFGFRVPR
jgi:hypothetical protein